MINIGNLVGHHQIKVSKDSGIGYAATKSSKLFALQAQQTPKFKTKFSE